MKPEQAMGKIDGWDNLTTGQLDGDLHMPEDLQAEARQAAPTRNYLVHGFLRVRAVFLHDRALGVQADR